MRSIRLSLVVYFLFLEAIALGTASWLVYRTAAQSLAAEHSTNHKLLVALHEDHLHEAHAKLDAELLSQAKSLALLTQSRHQQRIQEQTQLMPLGLLTACLAPQGHSLAPVWAASGLPSGRANGLNQQLSRRLATEIPINEDLLHRDTDLVGDEFFQINSWWGAVSRSKNLGDDSLPFNAARFSNNQLFDWYYDDVPLPNGATGRRVQLKSPVTRFRFIRETPPGPPIDPRDRTSLPAVVSMTQRRPQDRAVEIFSPWIVVHCVSETGRRDAQIARLSGELAIKVRDLESEASAALKTLRTRLIVIAVSTFLATVLGGSLLVGLGLAPLRRLGDAVGKVSEKDFRLPIDEDALPHELGPIVTRLRATLGQLGQAFDREKQAVADISHELRTPVTALLATLDVVLRKPRSAEEYRNALIEARSVGGHLRQLVEKLLVLARIDAGVARIQVNEVDIAGVVSHGLSLIRPLAVQKNVTMHCDIARDLLWVTDHDKLHDLLVNLLHNAVQYNRPGGSIHVDGAVESGQLVLSVRDTGIGIADSQIPHLFERFYRADPSREQAALHAGLGLAIVRGYVELLGGTIGVSSTLGEGTTFRISLPPLQTTFSSREAA